MDTKSKVNLPRLLLLAIALATLSCEHKSAIEANKDEEITWQQTSLDSLNISSLAVHPSGSIFAAGCGSGIFRSTDHGTTWTLVNTKCVNFLAVHANGTIFGADSRYIFRSMNNGETWTMLRFPLGSNDLRAFAFNPTGDIFAGGVRHDESRFGGIYRSVDAGDNWLGTNFPDSIGVGELLITQQGHIFAGTTYGVFRSLDNAQTWYQINNGLRTYGDGPNVSDFAINPINGDIFVAIQFDGIYRSSNNGGNWSLVGLDLPNSMLPYLLVNSVIFNSRGHAFAACGGYNKEPEGVFFSPDNGETWSQINNGLTSRFVFALAVDDSGYVYAGTHRQGVFRTTRSTTTK